VKEQLWAGRSQRGVSSAPNIAPQPGALLNGAFATNCLSTLASTSDAAHKACDSILLCILCRLDRLLGVLSQQICAAGSGRESQE